MFLEQNFAVCLFFGSLHLSAAMVNIFISKFLRHFPQDQDVHRLNLTGWTELRPVSDCIL